jgi:hypothetical protein
MVAMEVRREWTKMVDYLREIVAKKYVEGCEETLDFESFCLCACMHVCVYV